MRHVLLIAALLSSPALAQEGDDGHVAEVDGVRVLHAWTNAGDANTAEVYMEIENEGDVASNLTSIAAEGAVTATVVASPVRAEGGVPETLDGILLPPGVDTVLQPRGIYVLLHGLDAPREEGDEMALTLTFEPQGELEVLVRVEAPDATEHSDADHSH